MTNISVITPVYKGEKFIESCIENVVDQNCPEVEHIIVDGGSTDETISIVKHYAEKYSHIRWVSEKDNGQSDAMNKGIALAKAKIISFLNVDDFYEEGTLNKIVRHFENLPEPTFLVGNCKIWDDSDKLQAVNKPQILDFISLISGSENVQFPLNPSAYFYHKSLHETIGLYDTSQHYIMDIDFILRAVRVANVKYIDQDWGNYRKIEGTKTVIGFRNGQNLQLLRKLIRKQHQYIPWPQRLYVTAQYEYNLNLERVRYFRDNPHKMRSAVESRLQKTFSATPRSSN